MKLLDFKTHIESAEEGTVFNFGISSPFSWRGSYDEVAFTIIEEPMSREIILERIRQAYHETFYGYKGGEYEYGDYTTVNFEEGGCQSYSDGAYTAAMIAKIEGSTLYQSQEARLVGLAFKL